jgi:PAS domain S-box-containing protein
VMISLGGRRLEGQVESPAVHATFETFETLGRRWRIDAEREPPSGLQSALPWLALGWPFAAALLGLLVGRTIVQRRRAQRSVDRIFDFSPDLLASAGFDGYFKRVNPAFERTLGYPAGEFLSRPYLEFVHPDDRVRTSEMASAIGEGQTTLSFENRYLCKDGSYRWIQWTSRPVPEEGVMYGMGRDVTERRRAQDEQAALRRVATLIAHAAPSEELLGAVSKEVGTLFGADLAGISRYEDDDTMTILPPWSADGGHLDMPGRVSLEGARLPRLIRDTGRPAREDAWDEVAGEVAELTRDRLGIRSAVGSPIVVEGRVWGALFVSSTQSAHLPGDTESRLENFTELVATAVANAQARADVQRLVDEQAALRRVATLVAREASQTEVFTAIAEEIGQLLGTEEIRMLRYEEDDSARVVARWGDAKDVFPINSRVRLEGQTAASRVFRTGRPVRIDDYVSVSGPVADTVRSIGIRTVAATPINVEGRLWGTMVTGTTRDEALPPETEARLGQFTELMATTIGNTESHARAERLAEEQAALRRVATLVAKESPPAEVFAKVAEELANVLGDVDCSLFRDEGDGSATAVALWGTSVSAGVRVGTRLPVDGDGVIASVLREGRPCRIGDCSGATGAIAERGREVGIRSAVGCPIVVGGRIWGVMGAGRYEAEAFPPETERRIAQFADLVATAIANAEALAEVERLAEEQAALRRVATQVAEGAAPTAVFDAVAGEMEALLDADQVALNRFEPGAKICVLAHRGLDVARTPVGSQVSHEGESVTATVRRTGRPARMEDYEGAPGALAELARDTGLRASVAAPIVVDGRLWGIITASWKGEESPPADTEERMAHFAELLDTAIANADSRDQLTASRARLLSAGDEARRRVVRDLHDGAQQRLVHTIVTLKLAQRAFREDDGEAESLIGEALGYAERGNAELRELAHGILPSVLSREGLRAGVDAFAARLDVPVQVDVPAGRFPAEVEASAYFIVAEALTNVVKHAHARRAEVRASVEEGMLRVEVRDDGIGGADPDGRGLVGMGDRVTALGGRLKIESPSGGGTLVVAAIPLPG